MPSPLPLALLPVIALHSLLAPAMADPPAGPSLREAYPAPAGFERVDGGDWGAWLGALTLRDPSVPVRTFDGRVVGHSARVVELPLVPGDLQQCADSLIRLRSEWLRARGRAVSWHATSGDPLPWSRYAAGERPVASGNHITWTRAKAAPTWEGYLSAVFTWAGTRSLQAYETLPDTTPEPGDLLVQGGSPGHAVLLLDVARRGPDTLLLVGEGFMPAQDFHVELGPEAGWWTWGAGGIDLPSWSFEAAHLRRWR